MSSPPRPAVASTIAPWMRQARSQVGSRLAVASRAKISRPRPPPFEAGGAFLNCSRNASISADPVSAGRPLLPPLIIGLSCRLEPDRGVVKDGAAPRQAGIGAGQEIDPDAAFESMVGPNPLDDHDPLLQPVEGLRVEHHIAPGVADAQPVAVAE